MADWNEDSPKLRENLAGVLREVRDAALRRNIPSSDPAICNGQPVIRGTRVLVRTSVRARGKKSLFFCQSRSLSETVAERMRGRGAEVFVHHSSVSRDERREAEARFHHGTDAAIVCTSTLELGIDVGDLDLVFQANAPSTVSSFMQRMGRTGRRAGQVAICESPEDVLQAVAIVELARKGWVESVPVQDRCWPILVHQILAQTLQFGAISAERCFERLARVPDFRGITPAERNHLIEHLTKEEYLFYLTHLGTSGEAARSRASVRCCLRRWDRAGGGPQPP